MADSKMGVLSQNNRLGTLTGMGMGGFEGVKRFLGTRPHQMVPKMGKEHSGLKPDRHLASELEGACRWRSGQQPGEHLPRQEQCSRSSGPWRGISLHQLHLKVGTVRISWTTILSKGSCDWVGLFQALETQDTSPLPSGLLVVQVCPELMATWSWKEVPGAQIKAGQ